MQPRQSRSSVVGGARQWRTRLADLESGRYFDGLWAYWYAHWAYEDEERE